MRGPKPQPTALKVLRGNPGRRRLNVHEPQPRAIAPDPPAKLDGEALAEWTRRAPQLAQLGLLTEVDLPAFETYCREWARYVAADQKCRDAGEVVKAPSGYPIPNPYRAIANKALKQCQAFWAEFAMMPSSRSRVGVSAKGGALPESKVDRFMRRVK